MAESDETLYSRVKQGDLVAFDELYARYSTRLFRFLRAQLPTADAEDVFHEAMLATLESREVTFAAASFKTWLYRIAQNRVLNRRRSRGRGDVAMMRLQAGGGERPLSADDRIAEGELARALERAVGRLPEKLSTLYHLRASGLSQEEMATVLGIPVGTIKSRTSEMVRVLREELRPWTAR